MKRYLTIENMSELQLFNPYTCGKVDTCYQWWVPTGWEIIALYSFPPHRLNSPPIFNAPLPFYIHICMSLNSIPSPTCITRPTHIHTVQLTTHFTHHYPHTHNTFPPYTHTISDLFSAPTPNIINIHAPSHNL